MSNESIEQMRERLAQYDAEAARAATHAELDRAIAGAGVQLKPGTADQVRTLLAGDIRRYVAGNEAIVAGPGGKPLVDHLRERFDGDLAHFRAEPEPQQPQHPVLKTPTTANSVGIVANSLRSMLPGAMPAVGAVEPAATLGAAAVAATTRPAADPRMDMGQPFGLRRTR